MYQVSWMQVDCHAGAPAGVEEALYKPSRGWGSEVPPLVFRFYISPGAMNIT